MKSAEQQAIDDREDDRAVLEDGLNAIAKAVEAKETKVVVNVPPAAPAPVQVAAPTVNVPAPKPTAWDVEKFDPVTGKLLARYRLTPVS